MLPWTKNTLFCWFFSQVMQKQTLGAVGNQMII